ncbi:MAG: tetratricopeptide repeat protein [Candidatus Omnitrophica bacterium]|nr:tetratricopeptide repeat protein [Candidatus Omnitrophota bacterium]
MSKDTFLLALFLLLGVSVALADPGASEVRAGNAAYRKADFKSALDNYEAAAAKAPNDARIDYNLGVAAYKNGDFTSAVGSFNKALLSEDPQLARNARYDLGNALYMAGAAKEEQDTAGAIKNLEESIASYNKVILDDVKSVDAKGNKTFVESELVRLRKKLEEQKKQQSDSKQCDRKKPADQPKPDQQQKPSDQAQKGQEDKKDQPPGQQEQKAESENKDAQDQKNTADQKPKDDQKTADQPKPGEKNSPEEPAASAGQAAEGHILSQDEANMLLDDFAQNEQPKGLLKLQREAHQERGVVKDW